MKNHHLRLLHRREEISETVLRLAAEIEQSSLDREVVLVGVLLGSFMFLADLARALSIPAMICFLQVKSYGKGTDPGPINLVRGLDTKISGRDVILVEDIVDTGQTSSFLMSMLQKEDPRTCRLCTLLDKPGRRSQAVQIDFKGFETEDHFVVGYGLDYDERYRHLADLYALDLPPGRANPA